MYFEEKISQVIEKISENEFEEAVHLLKQYFKEDPILDELVIISAELIRINKKVRIGTIDAISESVQKNKIGSSLIEICKELRKKYCNFEKKNPVKQFDSFLIKSNRYERELQECYSKIYYWMRDIFDNINHHNDLEIDNKTHEYYKQFVRDLPNPEHAEYTLMITISYRVLHNDLNFLLSYQSSINSSTANIISDCCEKSLRILEKSTVASFSFRGDNIFEDANEQEADSLLGYLYSTYFENIKSKIGIVKNIFDGNMEEKNLGGLIAAFKSNVHLDANVEDFGDDLFLVFSPFQLGFKLVEDPDSLPMLIMSNKLELENVFLHSDFKEKNESLPDDYKYDNTFKIRVNLFNHQEKTVKCTLPKGLIFESKSLPLHLKNIGNNVCQNLALKDSLNIDIPSKKHLNLDLEAYCINKNFSPPKYEEGNVTIFELANKNYNSNNELWNIISKLELDIANNISR